MRVVYYIGYCSEVCVVVVVKKSLVTVFGSIDRKIVLWNRRSFDVSFHQQLVSRSNDHACPGISTTARRCPLLSKYLSNRNQKAAFGRIFWSIGGIGSSRLVPVNLHSSIHSGFFACRTIWQTHKYHTSPAIQPVRYNINPKSTSATITNIGTD